MRQEITKEEYNQNWNKTDYFVGVSYIYPEDYTYWKWLDGYYEEELEEKKEVLVSFANSSSKKYYECIQGRLYNKDFTKVSQKFIDLVMKEKRNTYIEVGVENHFVITGIERLA